MKLAKVLPFKAGRKARPASRVLEVPVNGDDEWMRFGEWTMEVSFAQELERAQADLTDLLGEILHADDGDYELETPSGYPYCGCSVCDVREALITLLPLIAEAYEQGRLGREAV